MHRTSRAERLTTSVCDSTTTPQPFLYPERRLQPVAGRRHAPWAEIVKLPTRYMYFLFFCALLSLCSACLSNAIFFHVCVCVFFPSILDIKFVGRTSRGHTGGRSHRIFNPPSFCGACLDFCREKDSAIPFPRRP